jgi:RNA polymerase sigma-70 factor (ECF subfamily)
MHAQIPQPAPAPNDDADFVALYRQWYRPLVALCRRCTRGVGDPEALAQEAFVRAWRAWDSYTPGRPFWPWISSIARRLCINEIKGATRHAVLLDRAMPRLVSEPMPPDEQVDSLLDGAMARSALEHLTAKEQNLLVLREMEGWSYGDISQATGLSVEGVRGALRRARCAFRAQYERVAGGVFGAAAFLDRLRRLGRRVVDGAGGLVPVTGRFPLAELLAVALGFPAAVAPSVPPAAVPAAVAPAAEVHPAVAATSTPPAGSSAGVNRPSPSPVRAPAPAPATSTTGGQVPLDDSIEHFAVSPSYEDDRTVYASGRRTWCDGVACPVLYRSNDGGRNWVLLPAAGRRPGHVLLPPSYPRDDRIFSVGSTELQVSVDGGATFTTVGPANGVAAISPSFSDGDPRILLGNGTGLLMSGLEYHDHDRTVRPLSLVLPVGGLPSTYWFSPDYATDRTVFVGGTRNNPQGIKESAVFACSEARCRLAQGFGMVQGGPTLVSSPTAGLVAWWPFHIFRSRDGGGSFEPIAFPGRVLLDLRTAPDGRLFITVTDDPVKDLGRVHVSSDGGTTWTETGGGLALQTLAFLPDGRVLGAPVAQARGRGLVCSADDGRTWHSTCA